MTSDYTPSLAVLRSNSVFGTSFLFLFPSLRLEQWTAKLLGRFELHN